MKKNTLKIDITVLIVLLCLIGAMIFGAFGDSIFGTHKRDSNEEPTMEELRSGTIGVLTGSMYDDLARENFTNAKFEYFSSTTDMLINVELGKIDAFIDEQVCAVQYMIEHKSIGYLPEKVCDVDYGTVFPKNEQGNKLCTQYNKFLSDLAASGDLAEMQTVWFSTEGYEDQKTIDLNSLTGENGTLHYSTSTDLIPFCYFKNNQIVGYEIDLAVRFCKAYGYKLEIASPNYEAIIPSITGGKADFASAAFCITEERKQSVYFSDPTYSASAVIIVNNAKNSYNALHGISSTDKQDPTVEDLQNSKIGILSGSNVDVLTQKLFPNAKYEYINTITDLALNLSLKKIDAFLLDESGAHELMAQYKNLGYIDQSFGEIEYGAVFPKTAEGDALLAKYNQFLAKSKENGLLAELQKIWCSDDTDESKRVVDLSGFTGENGTLHLGTSSILFPFSYMKNNQIVGYDIDLAARFCREYGYKLDVIDITFDSLIPALLSGKFDMAAVGITITEERKESVNFSTPNYTSQILLMVRDAANSYNALHGISEEAQEGIFDGIIESFEKNFLRENRWQLILQGIGVTLLITISSALLGCIAAFGICILRRTGSSIINNVCNVYVRLLQGTPMVVLLMILYYVIFGNTNIDAIIVAIVGFSLNLAAYASEIMRSSIESIDGGQREAALALGFTEKQAFYKFIFPQAAVRFLPVLKGELVSLLKSTSIVGYITIQDLTKMSDIIRSRTYEAFFPLFVTAVIYFLLSWIMTTVLGRIEFSVDPKRIKKVKDAKRAKLAKKMVNSDNSEKGGNK